MEDNKFIEEARNLVYENKGDITLIIASLLKKIEDAKNTYTPPPVYGGLNLGGAFEPSIFDEKSEFKDTGNQVLQELTKEERPITTRFPLEFL